MSALLSVRGLTAGYGEILYALHKKFDVSPLRRIRPLRHGLRIPAWIVLAGWIALQVVMFVAAGDDEVSWAAHIGGILAGALLVLLFRRRGVPLFDREIVAPAAVELAKPDMRGEATAQGPWGRQ